MLNYFNPETKTLTVPYDFNEKERPLKYKRY